MKNLPLAAAALIALAGSAEAQSANPWVRVNGYDSIGTAYKYVTGTDVTVPTGSTVSASFGLATSDTSVFRIMCDQYAHAVPVCQGQTANIVSPSGLRAGPGSAEYFPMEANCVPAFRADTSTAVCNTARMKK